MYNKEIVVVGLGVMGSAALYHLARRGVAPVGLEQYQIGHSSDSSHGHSELSITIQYTPSWLTPHFLYEGN